LNGKSTGWDCNRVIDMVVERIRENDPDFESFGVHDLRRTFSTGLNRAKFDDRWIEMSLAHAPRNRIAAIYNVNRYLAERKIMLQCWADNPVVRARCARQRSAERPAPFGVRRPPAAR